VSCFIMIELDYERCLPVPGIRNGIEILELTEIAAVKRLVGLEVDSFYCRKPDDIRW